MNLSHLLVGFCCFFFGLAAGIVVALWHSKAPVAETKHDLDEYWPKNL